MTVHGDHHRCFTDFGLEEYVQGRLDPEIRTEVDAHVVICVECRRAVDLLKTDCALLGDALRASPRPTGMAPADELTLAAYLDGALELEDSRDLESRLIAEPALLAALVRLSEEVEAAMSDTGTGSPEVDQGVHAGQMLRMPTRMAMPAVIAPAGLRFGDGRSA